MNGLLESILREVTADSVAFDLSIPVPLLDEFNSYQEASCLPVKPRSIEDAIVESLEVLAFSSIPFNRPLHTLSAKARLGPLRLRIEEGPHQSFRIQLRRSTLALVVTRFWDHGVSELEACLLAIDYHAGVWRKEQAVKTQTPGDRFSKALAKEGGRKR